MKMKQKKKKIHNIYSHVNDKPKEQLGSDTTFPTASPGVKNECPYCQGTGYNIKKHSDVMYKQTCPICNSDDTYEEWVSFIFLFLGFAPLGIDMYFLANRPMGGTFQWTDGLLLIILIASLSMIVNGIWGIYDVIKRKGIFYELK